MEFMMSWDGAFMITSRTKFVGRSRQVYIPNAIELTDNVSRSEVKVEYFTLDGRRLAAPVKGIVVKRTVFGNGTVATKKIVVK